MITKKILQEQIKLKKSMLCIGLDTAIEKLPLSVRRSSDPIFEFNKQIIDATHTLAVAYKPNLAFYEAYGIDGMRSLMKTVEYIKQTDKNLFLIADAKRGDIGNTASKYATAIFDTLGFDAITLSPYMGFDSVEPFLGRAGKWIILLALTSNLGSHDFQKVKVVVRNEKDKKEKKPLYQHVIDVSKSWGNDENTMYVVGATQAKTLQKIRQWIPEHFILVPGVGTQGGDLESVLKNGMNQQGGLFINASRSIIYASNENDFAEKAAKEASSLQTIMQHFLSK